MKNEKKNSFNIVLPLISSLISFGPIGWHIIDIFNGATVNRLLRLFIISIILTIGSSVIWVFYFILKNKPDEGSQD
ncbi:MAG: hypothetical protein ACOWWH_13895 [Eubacteriaceae bacterium]